MRKPDICIVGWKVGDNSFGVTTSYLEYFSQFGQVHILTPTDLRNLRIFRCDLLVLPGGRDVDTRRYGQMPHFKTGYPDHFLEHFDKYVLPMYIERQIPVFGICRGLQTLAVHYGHPLTQDLLNTHSFSTKSRYETVHGVFKPENYSFISKKFSKDSEQFKVNSLHHQGVKWQRLIDGSELEPLLVTEDYYVEALQHKTLPIAAVQWHPEELEDDFSAKLIKSLIEWKRK